MTTYIQATLRYLNKMDKDVTSGSATAGWKNQGEGWGFSLVVADYIAANDADGAATINAAYSLDARNSGSTNYCTGLSILLKILPSGTTLADLGTLNEDYSSDGVDYTSGACIGPNMAGLV